MHAMKVTKIQYPGRPLTYWPTLGEIVSKMRRSSGSEVLARFMQEFALLLTAAPSAQHPA